MSVSHTKQVFYDESGRRGKWSAVLLLSIVPLLLLFCAVFVLGMVKKVEFPSLSTLAATVIKKQAVTNSEKRFFRAKSALQRATKHPRRIVTRPLLSVPSTYAPQYLAYLVNWDDASFTSFKRHSNQLDGLMPEWLHLQDASGEIVQDQPEKQQMVRRYIQTYAPYMQVYPMVNNYVSAKGGWLTTSTEKLLADPVRRQLLERNLLTYVQTNHDAGLTLDIEELSDKGFEDFAVMVEELHAQMSAQHLKLIVTLPFANSGIMYERFAAGADSVVLMAYDEHWSSSAAGPISSIDWFTQTLAQRAKQIPASKLVVALGNYGYDWSKKGEAAELTYQEAVQGAQESQAEIVLDPLSRSPEYTYADDLGELHTVWFLDAVASFNQLAVALPYQPQAFALWRLGSEDPSLWDLFNKPLHLDASSSAQLKHVQYGYDVDYEGQGEVLQITGTPADGSRDIFFDAAVGEITQASYSAYPSSYVIQRTGGSDPKAIALTFDDGPDPRYTPRILDILKQKNVKATFFMIGTHAEENPALLQRVVDEGHDIGNHTFTHPNLAMINRHQVGLELNATQRLFESRLGFGTRLFRPPYAEDVEPVTPDQVRPLVRTSSLGYFTIGMHIDPNDWSTQTTADQIVQRVMDQAQHKLGNIVLLHDSGGNREPTIEALPKLIDTLRADGYHFVSVSELVGGNRATLFPPVLPGDKTMLVITGAGFSLISGVTWFLRWFFLLGVALGVLRVGFLATLAGWQWLSSRNSTLLVLSGTKLPFVSVIVPVHNESIVVERTIQALLRTKYPRYEVIVVDDGSSDNTAEVLRKKFGHIPNVRLLSQENLGKAAALNHGLEHAKGDIIVTADGDTLFEPGTVSALCSAFLDPKVVAVAGNTKVGNRRNLLTRMQALEYITSQNLERRAFTQLNCVTVVPGAVGAWRAENIRAVGGFPVNTLAEDADLTLLLLAHGGKVVYVPQAKAYTEAPETWSGLLRQRFRWSFGTLQAGWKQRQVLFRWKSGALGWVGLPNLFIFQLCFPFMAPILDLIAFSSIAWVFLQTFQHPHDTFWGELVLPLGFYAGFLLLDMLMGVLSFLLEDKEDLRLLWLLPLQRFIYRHLLYFVVAQAIFTAWHGGHPGWRKVERWGSVNLEKLVLPTKKSR